jgi:endonuclease YncB( thermonuclease family)
MRAIVIGLTVLLVAAAASYERDTGEAVVPGTNGKIVFVSDRVGNEEIYVMNADGSGQTRLTNSATEDRSPAWSPDGHRIAFSSLRDGDEEIYVMNADGSGQTRLTDNADFDGFPAWSPDGTRIAFTSNRDSFWGEIYVMNADGSRQTNLTNAPASDGDPAWSPDGKRIAFASDRNGDTDIYVMNADGSLPTRLTTSLAYDDDPDWQAPPVTCTIASVIDGDTFTCTSGKTVDMLQIDAAEVGQCGGGWAKAALENIFLPPGREVRLDFDSTQTAGANTLAAPVARGTDGTDYNLSIVMAYVGLAKSTTVGANNTRFLDWANASQTWAQAAQWNMWAPGKTYTGGCD